jgi:hypothetical protein
VGSAESGECAVELDNGQTWRYLTWATLALTLFVYFIFKNKLAAVRTRGGGAAAHPRQLPQKCLSIARMCYFWGAVKCQDHVGVAFLTTFPSLAESKRYFSENQAELGALTIDEVGNDI